MDKKEIIFSDVIKEFSARLPKFSDGRIDYSASDKAPVLTCFVKYDDKILLLKRSGKVRTYQGLWNSVSGYLDELCLFEDKVRQELREELGIEDNNILEIKAGEPYEVIDDQVKKTWIIFPALAQLLREPEIRLDWEHTEYQWIDPKDIKKFAIVFDLDNTLARVL